MGNGYCRRAKIAIPCFVSMCFSIALIILFIMGGMLYHQERRKEINYDNDTCLVLKQDYRSRICGIKLAVYTCFGAVWDVRLSKMASINATVDSKLAYPSTHEALAATKDYPVGICKDCDDQ